MTDKTKTLQNLIHQLDHKQDFVHKVAKKYNASFIYLLHNWFQRSWKIPEDKIDDIIKMAQIDLDKQTTYKRNLLLETGFKNLK